MKNQLAIFENFKIRRHFDEKKEVWYFSVVDIIVALTQSDRPRKYWNDLKNKLKLEGSELSDRIGQLKMMASDGKYYLTDVLDVENILRLVQSIPSPKVEPLKLWLAKVGYERMQEMTDPERSINRARENWQKHGRSQKWIQQRMMGQETRNKLTDYWSEHDVKKGEEFAILTNIIHQEWSDLSVRDHKNKKGLKTQNLRDHMSEAELIFTALAELSTREIAETVQSQGLEENKSPAHRGGQIARDAKKALEAKTGKSVVTGENFLPSKTRIRIKSKKL
ncbi:antirepressor [Candidatus Nomurabacteria bacterium RIFCSPLOWO2_02_FULL_40_10]|uniref:Antirepressor n=2 Tax=Candidatus Nomuraibacteriota TaxID=1752729 RepID=A0A1F6XVU3_9BACT|nr:MAG: antirepressor [Candidatus Nomurabacteria bacterium RIFCSPHIGHO2_01_FULL_39_10]OGI98251.1 MAG: antirepressor [Candidatus Nomurabacteria bacterium RIFCSPLOWO2_02_FULL_40_10]